MATFGATFTGFVEMEHPRKLVECEIVDVDCDEIDRDRSSGRMYLVWKGYAKIDGKEFRVETATLWNGEPIDVNKAELDEYTWTQTDKWSGFKFEIAQLFRQRHWAINGF